MDPAAADDLALAAGQTLFRLRGRTGTDEQRLGSDLLSVEERVVGDLGEPQAETIGFQGDK